MRRSRQQLSLLGSSSPSPRGSPPSGRCFHLRAYPGLDAHFCPDCGRSILAGTTDYSRILFNSEAARFLAHATEQP